MTTFGSKPEAAFELSLEILSAFAAKGGFADGTLDVAFGTTADSGILASIGEGLALGEAWALPAIETLDTLGDGILGGYVAPKDDADIGTVYLSAAFVATAPIEALVDVLLEEIGHAIDHQVNASDAPGDEGAIFARLVQGETMTDGDLAPLRAEDDHIEIVVAGETVEAEAASVVYNVNTTLDVVDPDDGLMSLREAIELSNARGRSGLDSTLVNPNPAQIFFDLPLEIGDDGLAVVPEIQLTSALYIDNTVHLNDRFFGFFSPVILRAAPGEDILSVNLNLNDTGTEGFSASYMTFVGGEFGGVTIQRAFNAELNNVTIEDNSGGAGLWIDTSNVNLNRVNILNNSAPNSAGGINIAFSAVSLFDSSVNGNSGAGGFGGGIWAERSDIEIVRSEIMNNTVSGNGSDVASGGGGISMVGINELRTVENDGGDGYALRIANSTVSGNSVLGDGDGGGVYVREFSVLNGGAVEIVDTEISGNSVADGSGGGLYYDYFGELTVTGSTISGNTSSEGGGGIFLSTVPSIALQPDAVSIDDSVISGNATTGDHAPGGGVLVTNTKTVDLTDTEITGNTTAGTGSHGGGIAYVGVDGVVTTSALSGTVINANATSGASANGGGVYAEGNVTVEFDPEDDVPVIDNSATGAGSLGQNVFSGDGSSIALDYLPEGTDGDDLLFGNDLANVLEGFAGNDVFFGFAGDDILQGGDDDDTFHIDMTDMGGTVEIFGGTGFNGGHDTLVLTPIGDGTDAVTVALGAASSANVNYVIEVSNSIGTRTLLVQNVSTLEILGGTDVVTVTELDDLPYLRIVQFDDIDLTAPYLSTDAEGRGLINENQDVRALPVDQSTWLDYQGTEAPVFTLSGPDADTFRVTGDRKLFTAVTQSFNYEVPNDADGDGVYEFTVTATVGEVSDSQDYAFAIADVNEQPTGMPNAAAVTALEGATGVIYTANATDPDGDALNYALSGHDETLFTVDAATGIVSVIGATDRERQGEHSFTVTASDGALSDSTTLTLTIGNVNEPLAFASDLLEVSVAETASGAIATALAVDEDGTAPTYALAGHDPTLFAIDAATGAISVIGALDYETSQTHVFSVTASDGTFADSQSVEISVLDVAEAGDATVTVDENVDQVLTTVFAPGNVAYGLVGEDAGAFQIDTVSGEIRFSASPDFEAPTDADGDNVYTATIEVTDFDLSSVSTASLTVTVADLNESPFFASDLVSAVIDEETAGPVYRASASDPDGGVRFAAPGELALFTTDAGSGRGETDVLGSGLTFNFDESRWRTDATAPGGPNVLSIDQVPDRSVFTVGDFSVTSGLTASQWVRFDDLDPTSDDPLILKFGDLEVANFDEFIALIGPDGLIAGDQPFQNGLWTHVAFTVDAAGLGTLYVDGTELTSGQVGLDTTLTGNSFGRDYFSPFSINTGAFSDLHIADEALNADAITSLYASALNGHRGDTVSYSLGSNGGDESHFSIDPLTGVLSLVEGVDFESPEDQDRDNLYEVEVIATDAGSLSGAQIVEVTIQNINSAPVAGDDQFVTPEDTLLSGSVAGNDNDADGDLLSYTLNSDTANGDLTFNADGSFDYTPDWNYFGADSFSYAVSDGQGDAATANVAITVDPVNDAPIMSDSIGIAFEDAPFLIARPSSAADPDGDDLVITRIVQVPTNGSVAFDADGGLTYTPDANFNGSDALTYEVSDGNGGTASPTVGILVLPVNDAPVAADDAVRVFEDAMTLDLVDLLLGNDADIDGDALTITAIDTSGTLGTASFDATAQTLSFSADADAFDALTPGDTALTSFSYTVADGSGATSTATVSVTVDGVIEPDGNGRVRGKLGDDALIGDDGENTLRGRQGDDLLNGGAGDDRLFGDPGSDTFVFGLNAGHDIIADFQGGSDVIDARGALGVTTHAEVFAYFDTNGDETISGQDATASFDTDSLTLHFAQDASVQIRSIETITESDLGNIFQV